jgi:hypothetical protein
MTANLTALFFAVFSVPQEAVMWLAAMNETTLFFFCALALICWSKKRYPWAALAYVLALFSKESAIMIPVYVVLFDAYKRKKLLWNKYLWLLIPTAGFAAIFFFTVSNNFMLTNRSYIFGPHGILVIGKSLLRLIWPWFYIILVLVWAKTRRRPDPATVSVYFALIAVTMIPYMFISYQTYLLSRQVYLASAVLLTLYAVLLKPLRGTALLAAVATVFVAFNIGYTWLRKDRQFEERAAPTTQLINILKQHRPQRTIIDKFYYPYPIVASSTALAVPGWDPEMISTDEQQECGNCLRLEWNNAEQRYRIVNPGE